MRKLLTLAFAVLFPFTLVVVVSLVAAPAAAQECDPQQEDPPCDPPPPGDTQAPSVAITPSGGLFGSATKVITIQWCDNVGLNFGSQSIRLNGVDVTSNFDFVAGSSPGCADFATSTGNVTFNLGGNSIDASIQDPSWNVGQGVASFSVQNGFVMADAAFNNFENQRADRCEVGCFAARYAQSTVPYFSMGAPRAVTLIYDGDRAHPMPVVYVDVTQFTQDVPYIQEYWLEAKVNGAFRTFRNGETRLKFAGHQAVRRFAGQLDVRDLQTGMYPLDLILTVNFGYAVEIKTFSTKLLVVNENNSTIARGWSVAGLQRLYANSSDGSALITEGDGSAAYFASCGTNCYAAPRGDFSRLTFNTSNSTYTRSYVDSTKVVFDVNGYALSVTDRLGDVIGYKYDGSNRLWKIEDPYRTYAGGTQKSAMILTYDANGLSRVDEPGPDGSPTGGRATTFSVDGSRRLVAITDPDNVSTALGYDASLRLSTVTDRRGSVSQFVYDPVSWKLSQLIMPQIAIDAGGGNTQLVTPTNTYLPWQTVGVPTTSTASSPATPLPPDSTIGRVTDAENRVTRIRVDWWGQALSITDPIGRVTSISRNFYGLPYQITRPTGVNDVFDYNGPLVSMVQLAGESPTHIRYGVAGQPDSIYGPGRRWVRRYLHAATGRIDSVKIQLVDSVARYSYDARHRVIEIRDQNQHRWNYHYDTRTGNLDSTHASPSNHFSVTRYDGFGRDSAVIAEGQLTGRVVYDALNRPREIFEGTQPDPMILTYDSLFLRSVRDRKGQIYAYHYNALGWITREDDPTTASMTYRHDRTGLVKSSTNRRGQIVDYRYDAIGRLVSKKGMNVATDSFAYSPDNRKLVAISTYSLDSLYLNLYGQADSAATWLNGKRYRRRYRWNGNDVIDSIGVATTSAIVFAQRRYVQPTGLLDTLRISGQAIRFIYNKEFQRTSTLFPVGSPNVTRSEFYTSLHQLYRTSFNTTGIDAGLWRNYAFDAQRRIRQEDRKNGSQTKLRIFGYNDRGHLETTELSTVATGIQCPPPNGTEIINDGTNCVQTSTRTVNANFQFYYDSAGNLRQQTESVAGATLTAGHNLGNRISSWGSTSYQHDADGNRTSKTVGGVTTTYVWSADGRLTSVTSGSTTLRYDYNAAGRPVRRTRNWAEDRYFLWDGDHLMAELNASSQRVAEYVYGPGVDNPVAIVTGPTTIAATRYLQEDRLGNVVGVFNTGLAQTLQYDVRGRTEAITGTLADTNRLRWKGLMWEGDVTQMYYARNRWYDPETGRFITEDPIGLAGGSNLYTFASNNPITGFDPFGLEDEPCPEGTREVVKRVMRGETDEIVRTCEAVPAMPGDFPVVGPPAGPRGPSSGDGGVGDNGGGGGSRSDFNQRVDRAACAAGYLLDGLNDGLTIGTLVGMRQGMIKAPAYFAKGSVVGAVAGTPTGTTLIGGLSGGVTGMLYGFAKETLVGMAKGAGVGLAEGLFLASSRCGVIGL